MLSKIFNKVEEKTGFDKKKVIAFIFSVILVLFLNFDLKYLHGSFTILLYILGALLVTLLIAYAMLKAGFTVIRSLCLVGAEVSLIIFLAQSYCGVVKDASPSDKSLVAFLSMSGIYIAYEFLKHLFSALENRLKNMPSKLVTWEKVLVIFFFLLFTTAFLSMIYQVIHPIISDLCVYKR